MDEELRGRELKWAYWLNTHRQEIWKIGRISGIGLVSIIWLIFLFYVIGFIRHYGATQRAYQSVVTTGGIYDSIQAPTPLMIVETDVLTHTDDGIDIYALVRNPNVHHRAYFTYTFTVQGQAFHFSDGILLPNEETYVVVSGLPGQATSDARLTIDEVNWQGVRGPAREADFLINDLALTTGELGTATPPAAEEIVGSSDAADEAFVTPTDETALDEGSVPGEPLTHVRASIVNSSAYGFAAVRLVAILKNSAGTIVGVQQIIWNDVQSFEERTVQFDWQRRFDFATTAEILVHTDIWDEHNLIYPGEGE